MVGATSGEGFPFAHVFVRSVREHRLAEQRIGSGWYFRDAPITWMDVGEAEINPDKPVSECISYLCHTCRPIPVRPR